MIFLKITLSLEDSEAATSFGFTINSIEVFLLATTAAAAVAAMIFDTTCCLTVKIPEDFRLSKHPHVQSNRQLELK